jgi:hypothetical protein
LWGRVITQTFHQISTSFSEKSSKIIEKALFFFEKVWYNNNGEIYIAERTGDKCLNK